MDILEIVKKYGTYRQTAPGEHRGPCPKCGGAMRFRIFLEKNEGKCGTCSFALSCEPEEQRAAEFDAVKAQVDISDACSRVFSARPKGCYGWFKENNPDALRHCAKAADEVDAAYAAEDADRLVEALKTYERYHLAAWKLYNDRPKVIEREALP